ncbi:hypothetical protein J0H58_15550, partial [bacterium]|nr:hypothetical protein [bacterium]
RVGGGPGVRPRHEGARPVPVGTPGGVPGTGDTAYLGTGLRAPARKPRGRSLTRRRKAGNRRVARERVVAGHGIGRRKVWRIAADRYRNPRSRHTVMVKNVAGRHNRMFG